jgi:hypothetical protein
MRFTSRTIPFFVLLTALAVGLSGVNAEPYEPKLSSDSRLQRGVTLRKGRAYLGEVVALLARQGNLSLSVSSSRGPVDGTEMFIHVSERPLFEVMDALQEVFSTKFDTWEWQVRKDGKGYILEHQRTPEGAALAARQELMAKWGEDLRTYVQIARMPEPQRSNEAKRRPDLFPGGVVDIRADLARPLTRLQIEALLKGALVPAGAPADDAPEPTLRDQGGPETAKADPGYFIAWDAPDTGPRLWIRNRQGDSLSTMGSPMWDDAWLASQSPGWTTQYGPEASKYVERLAAGPGVAGETKAATLAEWAKEAHSRHRLNLIVHPAGAPRGASARFGANGEQTVLAGVILV